MCEVRIILTGSKASGKSTIGRILGERLNMTVVETDTITEEIFAARHGRNCSCREICADYGEPFFRDLEHEAVFEAIKHENALICTGGQTMVDVRCREALCAAGTVVLLTLPFADIWARIEKDGYPSYFPAHDQKSWFEQRVFEFRELVRPVADIVCDVTGLVPADATEMVAAELEPYTVQCMHDR
jgi:shikimate kinase